MEICGGIPRQLPYWKLQQSLDLAPSLKSNMKGFSSSTLKDSKLHFPKPKLDSTTVAKRLLAQDGTKAKISKTKSLQGGLSLSKTFLQSINLDGTQNVKTTEKKEPEVKREISTLLEGWQVVLDLDNRESSFKERQKIKNEILDNGGLLGFSVSKKTTHVLVSNVNKKSYSFKCRSAQKFGIPVVRVDYLSDCLENGRILDIAPYVTMDREVSEENKENSLISGKIKGRPRAALDELPEKSENRAIDVSSLQWIQFDPGPDYQIAKSSFFANIKPFRYSKTFASSEKGGHQLELHVLPEKNLTKKFRIYWQSVEEGCTKFEYCCLAPTGMVALKIYTTVVKWLSSRESGSSSEAKWLRYGSPKFRKMYIESLLDSPFIDDPVQLLVDMVWQEAVGSASSLVDMEALTKEKLQKSEVILAKIKALLMDGTTSADILKSKSKEFYQQISYTNDHEVIDTKQKLNKMQDTLLLLQDVMNVQEATNWKRYCDLSNKYRSLRCHIEYVPHHTVQYGEVMDAIGDEVLKRNKVGIQNVFSLTRPIEESSFSREGKKMLPLFHATRATSLLGILSRGLLLPKVVEDDIGIERRDFGFLGQGIYFADDISANLHFAEVSSLSNTKFLFMCEVAVGKQYQTWQHQRDLTKPPQGFDSVLGMKNSSENPSSFKHNEYTVYDVSQQRLSYLIELIQDGEQLRFFPPSVLGGGQNLQEPPSENQAVDVSDVMDVPDPLDKVTPGLQTDSGEAILLESVSVKAKMMDLIAQVTVFQRYRNCNTKPIEAKYVFPLDDTAAVCGFEAFIGDKHIVGKVKEKEVAHKEYREAVSKGHGAYLMDEEAADVFTVSVGNLPPSTEVIIKITYVVELSLDGDRILFNLPGSLASWRKKGALSEETQDVTSTVTTGDDDEIKFDICLSIEMPFDIKSITCPSHLLKIKRTAAKACITLEEGQNRLREGFQLLVKLHKIHHPHMWVEQHPTDRDSQACMLTFYPEFEVPTLSKPDVTVILDCSNSMKGECFEHAQKVCLMIFSLMPPNFRVNLVKFGTAFAELYPSSQSRGKVGLTELKEFLSSSSPSEGNTDIWRPLHSNYLLQSGEEMRNLFLVTDGHIDNEAETLKNIATNSKTNRIFTFGVGSSSNKHMLKLMAHRGNGAFEFFDGKTKSTWMKKVRAQLKRASQPSVSSLSITWHQYDHNPVKSRQAPRTLGALFSGSRLLVYGFVSHCTSATLNAVINNQEISTIVSTSKLAITTGVTLHRLTARALIRDWEDGMLDGDRIKAEISREEEKASIVSLSKEYGIITSLTSFVAIEEREKDEVQRKRNMEEKLTQLLKDEDVDILPYMDWHAKQDMTEAYDRLEDPLDISEEEESEASESEGSSVSSHLENILHGWNSQPVKSRYSEVSLPDGLSSSSEDEDAERVALYTEDLAAPHKSKDFDSEFYSDLEFDSAVVDQPVEVVLCMDKDSEMEDKAINWTRRSAGVAFRRAGRKRLPEMPEVGLSTQTFKSHLARDSAVLPAAGKLLADEEKSESDEDYSLQVCDTLFGYYDDMPATETVVTGGEKKDKGARLKDIETEVRVGSADSSLAMETELVEDLAVMKPGKSSAKAGAAFRKARRKRLPEMPEVGLSTQTFKSHLARDSAALPAAGKLLADEEKSESVEDNFLQFLDFDDECLDDMDEIETVVTGGEEKDKGARPKETEVRVGSADSPIALETVRDEDFMKVKAMKSRKKVGTRVRVFDSKEVSPSVPDTNSSILLGSVDPPPPPPPAEAFGGMRSLHELAEDPVLGTSKRLSLGFASAEPQRLSSRTPRAPRAPQHIGASLSFSHATPPPPPGRAPLSRPPPPLPDRVPPSCLPPPPPPPGRAPLSRPPPLPLGRAPPSCLPPPPPPPAPGGPPPGRPPQGRSRPSLVPVCGVPPPVPAGGIPPQPPSAIGAPSVLPPPPQQPPRYVFGGPPPPGDGVPASFGYRPLSTSLQSPETGAPLRKSMFVDQSAAGLLPQLQKKVQFGRCSPKPPSDTPEASLLSGKEHSPIPPLTKGKVLPLSQPRQVGTSGPPPPPPPPPRASALSPTLTSILPPSVKRKSSTSPARMPRRVYESATPSLLRLDGGPKPTELPKSVTSSTEKASTAFDPINSSESVPSGGYLNRLKKSQPYQQVQTQSIEGLMPARTSHRRSFGYRLMTNLRAAPRNVSYSDIVEPKTKGYSSISSGKTSQTPIYSTEVRGPSVDSKITDEPNVDMKFELYKVPELKWSISSNTLEELFKILTKHDFISYKSCLDLCNIQVATFEAFFRHVGIFSLGQTAAIGFLDFFATWLAYVIIERVRPFFLTDLSNCKIWLEAQSKNYHVSDYQLGHSTWTEVALAMLKLKDVGFGMHFLTV